jgi:transposase-like protein
MSHQNKNNREQISFEEILNLLANEGLENIGEALRLLLNAAMRAERERYLGVAAYERSEQRRGYANGFKDKTLNTRLGQITVDVPQTRDGGFYPSSLERGLRSEKALKLALAEMYVQGVSTRKVAAITEELCGFELSSTQVSRVAKELDEVLESWRNRSLGCFPYIYLDARYEKVRHGGIIRDCAVLIAVGVGVDGKREVIGVSVELSEAEIHWRNFLKRLQDRGLKGVQLIVSDAHSGLREARQAVFPSVAWQRCQFHLQQNAAQYVPKQEMKAGVAADIRNIFEAPDRAEADRLLDKTIKTYEKSAPKLAAWLLENLPEGLTVFAYPKPHRRRIRTSNIVERVNQEIRRRTKVARLFPNEASCLRLVTAVVMEISEDWLSDLPFVSFEKHKEGKK